MRRTITTLNRFTTFTRSWRGKTGGVLLCFLIILFLSCRDDGAYIGLAKEPRLKAHFIDIPLNPSVIQFDGLLTRNTTGDVLPRILMGQYNDPLFGNMTVRGFANITPPVQVIIPTSAATLDSLVLQLKLDYYYYGGANYSEMHLRVHELLDTLYSTQGYYTTSKVNYAAKPSGETTFFVSPGEFDNALALNADRDTSNNKVFNVRVPIHSALGDSLLYDLASNLELVKDVKRFMGKYKGFALVMSEGDKIVGINPTFRDPFPKATDTKLSLYYSQGGVQSRADFLLHYSNNLTFGVTYPALSFSSITTDRSSTALNGIKGGKDFIPSDRQLYVQSGTALTTKFDLTNFYRFVDTVGHITFNSAELVTSITSTQRPPVQVQLRLLDSLNNFRGIVIDTLVKGVAVSAVDPYITKISRAISTSAATSANSTIDIAGDNGVRVGIIADPYEIDHMFITEFCQQIFYHKHDQRKVKSFVLMPSEVEFAKSVNAMILNPSVALRLYYSTPIVKIQ